MNEQIRDAIGGAFLGALIGLGIAWWLDSFSWVPIAAGAGVGALLGYLWGEDALDWLKALWWWT